MYRFSHLTFQEYLAAVEVAERGDYTVYTLAHAANPFWREVVLLEAGYLSTKNQAKTTQLIRAIADARQEPEPFHNLVLAAECVRDVGATRVEGNVAAGLTQRLQVVNVSWHDACASCRWLSEVTGKAIALSNQAEWEKAARGDQDQRAYPWGNTFDMLKCNSGELGIEDTTPVGIFPAGVSPYGCLDMSGNVWEWTHSYTPNDGREDVKAPGNILRVLRGGAFFSPRRSVRCAFRGGHEPYFRRRDFGFRVVVLPCR